MAGLSLHTGAGKSGVCGMLLAPLLSPVPGGGKAKMASAILQVENLAKRYGDVEAVRGVSFSVEEGEVFGLLGPNGAGKTTTVEILGIAHSRFRPCIRVRT